MQLQFRYLALNNRYPENEDYKRYYIQSLYKSGMYTEALTTLQMIENNELLEFVIKYEQEDLIGCKRIMENMKENEFDLAILVNKGCLSFKEEKYSEARSCFEEAMSLRYDPKISYNHALCSYELKETKEALNQISNIIENVNN